MKNKLINRHRNPIGILLRIPLWLFLFYSVWNHKILFVLLALIVETLLWILIPPIEKSIRFIDNVIEVELKWLKSKIQPWKSISLIFLFSAILLLFCGLFVHNVIIIGIAFALLILFNLLMNWMSKN